ncbi:hypothetical protein [Kitasatospora sp. LaBMicrA B282]|uniref:hypothetical protein n=1 Tax=Kitasatospora sp. LaBMicrA B282 TaxID=3420949 RepID=UPI003D0EDB70
MLGAWWGLMLAGEIVNLWFWVPRMRAKWKVWYTTPYPPGQRPAHNQAMQRESLWHACIFMALVVVGCVGATIISGKA